MGKKFSMQNFENKNRYMYYLRISNKIIDYEYPISILNDNL